MLPPALVAGFATAAALAPAGAALALGRAVDFAAGFAGSAEVLRGLPPVLPAVAEALVLLDPVDVVAMVCPICCICRQTLAVLP
ncbi:MAG: hypothetical protein K8F31_12505 [Roseovarius sp.]|nr:hypothetical protein [Roseovarius sp.]